MSESASRTESNETVSNDIDVPAAGAGQATERESSDVFLSAQDLDVTLRFEAGTLKLPMDRLAQVPPGYVFELRKPLDRQVIEIFANDRAVASGELVLIGDAVGVRVTSIYPRATDLSA